MVIDFSASVGVTVSPRRPEKLDAGRPSDKRDVLVDHGHRRMQDRRPVEIVKSDDRHLPRNLDPAVAQSKEHAFEKNRVRGVESVRPLLDRQACQQPDDATMRNFGVISSFDDLNSGAAVRGRGFKAPLPRLASIPVACVPDKTPPAIPQARKMVAHGEAGREIVGGDRWVGPGRVWRQAIDEKDRNPPGREQRQVPVINGVGDHDGRNALLNHRTR